MRKKSKITLIETIIGVAMLSILAIVLFISSDPAKTLADSADITRRKDIIAISDAITQYYAEKQSWPIGFDTDAAGGQVLGISGEGCDVSCSAIKTNGACLDITGLLVDEYIATIPSDPESGNFLNTDYYVNVTESGKLEVGACDPTNISSINVVR